MTATAAYHTVRHFLDEELAIRIKIQQIGTPNQHEITAADEALTALEWLRQAAGVPTQQEIVHAAQSSR